MEDEHVRDLAFRRLTAEQQQTLRASGVARRHLRGAVLLAAGECEFRFFVIDEGRVAVFEGDPDEGRLVTTYGPGDFTGDIDVLSGKPSLLTVVAETDTSVHELSAERVRTLIRQLPWLGDVLLEAFAARRRLLEDNGSHAVRVIGSRYSADTTRIRQFLARNLVPFTWVDTETDEDIDRVLRALGIDESQTPVVDRAEGLLHNPSNQELAEALGRRTPVEAHLYDVAIIGAGPAGLAAAVYAASEGLDAIVLEQVAPGGQAGCSSRIENYLGFPSGISGAELANRAMVQAYKFGAKVSNPSQVVALDLPDGGHPGIRLENGEQLWARSIIVASGVQYRLLEVEGRERFDGAGVYYTATDLEAPLCEGTDVVVVGAGNSAGQAAVYLAERARHVYLVVRGADLDASMSRYLASRIRHLPAIEVLYESDVVSLSGDASLEAVEVENRRTGERRVVPTSTLFSMIGAVPRTEWLPDAIVKDAEGFVRTGVATRGGRRPPYLLETSVPGVFAAGDVRAGSSKRVAAAVGEGSMAVQFVHRFLDNQ